MEKPVAQRLHIARASMTSRLRLLARPALFALTALAACAAPPDDGPIGSAHSPVVVCAKGPVVEGIDVSSWQGTIDWGRVRTSGKQYAIMRISDGSYLDKQFATNWAGSKSAGVIRGAYQFFRPGQDASAQADIVISAVGKLGAEDLPVTCDVEATDSQSAATIVSKLHVWVDKVEKATGKKPIIYTGKYFWNDNVASKDFASYALWIAAYGPVCPDTPTAWGDWKFFQYSDKGSVNGISGNVDLDKFNGTLEDLKSFAAGSAVCGPELCNGKDDNCDGKVDEGDVCENDALVLTAAAYAAPRTTDVDGDGKADVCGRGIRGFFCNLSQGDAFGDPTKDVAPLSDANGWADQTNWSTIRMGDIDGDGKADVCARANDAVYCFKGGATGFGEAIKGPALADAQGWGAPKYYTTMRLADVDGDGKDDLCARAAAGLMCWLSNGNGFGDAITLPAWSDDNGFGAARYFGTLRMADVNGDGKQDACIRAARGLECWLSDGKGFPTKIEGPDWSDAAGFDVISTWSTVRLADVDGDGKADACARSKTELSCHLSNGKGFGAAIRVAELSDASGWGDAPNYGTLRTGDVDGDGAEDLCVRADAAVSCYRFTGGAFASIDGPAWGDKDGWNAALTWPTFALGDVDGDHKADLCARGATGWTCAKSTGTGFGAPFTLAEYTNDGGWNVPQYAATLHFGGTRPKAKPNTDPSKPDDPPGVTASADASADASAGCSCRAAGRGDDATLLPLLVGVCALVGRRSRRRSRADD